MNQNFATNRYSTNYAELMATILEMTDEQRSKLLKIGKNINTYRIYGHVKKRRNDYPTVFSFGVLLGCALMVILFICFDFISH